jgi:hypothetical protein
VVSVSRRRGVGSLLAAASSLFALLSGSAEATPQISMQPHDDNLPVPGVDRDIKLPNGKSQQEEILKADYEQNLKDARDLTELTRTFELELEKNDRFVLSLGLLKKLDDIDRLTKRIRGRMRK